MYKPMSFIVDTIVYVDWGDSNYIKYPAGTIVSPVGMPVGPVKVRSSEETKNIKFKGDAASEIDISAGVKLDSLADACLNATNLQKFNFIGINEVTSVSSAWRGCTSLTDWNMSTLSYTTDFTKAWAETTSLTKLGRVNSRAGTIFWETFRTSGVQCIDLLDTTNQTDTLDMFFGTDTIMPDNLDRAFLEAGGRWINEVGCDANGIVCTDGLSYPGLEF